MRLLPAILMAALLVPAHAAEPATTAGEPAVAAQTSRATQEMAALSEAEMSGVSGAQGVVLEIKLFNNVDPITLAPVNCSAVVGSPNACRMGLEFAARTGSWLMLKEFFGSLHIKDMRLDVAFTPGVNTAYYNASRFQDASGSPLVPGSNPLNLPTVAMSYPATDAQATYDDVLSYVNIGRAWLESDAGVTPGYNRDTTLDSAFSIRMADTTGGGWVPDPDNPPDVKLSNHAPARMRFWGTAYVFGF